MSSTTAHASQITLSTRTAMRIVVAIVAAIALAVSLPLALRSTHTVFVKSSTPAGSTSPTGPSDLLRASHGG